MQQCALSEDVPTRTDPNDQDILADTMRQRIAPLNDQRFERFTL